jgi:hypothetical protein
MKKQLFIFFALIILFATSCNRVKTIENIKKLDSLEGILDTISKNQEEINFIGVKLAYDTLKADLDSITKYVTKLPVNKHHKEYFTLYSDLRREFKSFYKIEITKELRYSTKQIEALKKDVNNNAISQKQFNKYIMTEQTAISLLKKQNDKQLSLSKKTIIKFNNYRPVILEMIDSAKTSINK